MIKSLFIRAAGILVILASFGCQTPAYRDDTAFLVSAQANANEFPVYLNGRLCTDMEGFVGLCSKRIKSTEGLEFKFDAQPYGYQLELACTNGVTVPSSLTGLAGQPLSFTLKPSDFSTFRAFTCIGEIHPQDRAAQVSAKFRVQVVVEDAQYVSRETIYPTKIKGANYLVLGQYARTSHVFDQGKWSRYSKLAYVRIYGDPNETKAYSESYAMRFNYSNMSVEDSGAN